MYSLIIIDILIVILIDIITVLLHQHTIVIVFKIEVLSLCQKGILLIDPEKDSDLDQKIIEDLHIRINNI